MTTPSPERMGWRLSELSSPVMGRMTTSGSRPPQHSGAPPALGEASVTNADEIGHRDANRHGPVLVVPCGATEQHGPHLPLGTDTYIAEAVAASLVEQSPALLLGPSIAVGASGEHAPFPGTLSIGSEAMTTMVVELVRSADAFSGVVVVNTHGGNWGALSAANHILSAEGRRTLVWHPPDEAAIEHVCVGLLSARTKCDHLFPLRVDAHAGWLETSMMLHLHPELVDMTAAQLGVLTHVVDLMDELVQDGVVAVSPNGVLGDPTDACAQCGALLVEAFAVHCRSAVAIWTS